MTDQGAPYFPKHGFHPGQQTMKTYAGALNGSDIGDGGGAMRPIKLLRLGKLPFIHRGLLQFSFFLFGGLLLVAMALSPGLSSSFARSPSHAADSVRIHGQIRDTSGYSWQGYVIVSSFGGPAVAQGVSDGNGNYQFDVTAQDSYVVWAQPSSPIQVGTIVIANDFLDTWLRVDRGTRTDLTCDVIVKRAGALLLDAYDRQGKPLYVNDFPDATAFAAYRIGTPPVHKSVQLENRQTPVFWGWQTFSTSTANPAVILLPAQGTDAFTIWGLWNIPEAGVIMVEMDNGGIGFSTAANEVRTVNVPYEFARTELRKAQSRYNQGIRSGYTLYSDISGWLADAGLLVSRARSQLSAADGRGAAITAYQALTLIIRAKEQTTLEIARQDINRYRRPPVTVKLLGPDNQPIQGIQVAYRQINHDFMIGANWGGDGVRVGDTIEAAHIVGNYNLYSAIAKNIGFESLIGPPYAKWEEVQRGWPSRPYQFDDNIIVRKLADDGFRTLSPAIWLANYHPDSYPRYLEGLSYEDIKTAAINYVVKTLTHYKGKIQWWNLMNEPNLQNNLNFSPSQMLDFAQAVLNAGKAADPSAVVAVVLTSPGLERGYMIEAPGTQAPINFIPTHDYLRQMLTSGIHPDAVGIQFYYGAYYPAIDLGTASDLLEVFGRDFSIPIYINEIEYPAHEEYPNLKSISTLSWWHEGHTYNAQADWAVALYTLAYSKPGIAGIIWNLAVDRPIYATEDGRQGDGYIKRDGLTPRPMADALRNLFQSWMTTGGAMTDAQGNVRFNGFAGEYEVTVTGPNGAVREQKIHVREGQTNDFVFTFDQAQVSGENHQEADSSLGKALRAYSTTRAWGKTMGWSAAADLYARSLAEYNSGRYWSTIQLAEQVPDALKFDIDGNSDDWEGVQPLYSLSDTESQARGCELRRFWGKMDDSALYLLLDFSTTAPRREILFELDVDGNGTPDFHVHTIPMGNQYSIFVPEADATTLQNLLPGIDVTYAEKVEIRISLADLGNPHQVDVREYREDKGGAAFSTVIPSLGVITPPNLSSVSAPSFVIPLLQGDDRNYTGIALANRAGFPTAATLTAYRDDGDLLSLPGISNPTVVSLGTGEQKALLDSQIFGYSGASDRQGWVKIESLSHEIGTLRW